MLIKPIVFDVVVVVVVVASAPYFSSLRDYKVKLPVPPFLEYVNTQPKFFFLLLIFDASLEIHFQEIEIALP